MFRWLKFGRLSVRLTAAFLLAAVLGVALVALLAYRSTSSEFSGFLAHFRAMEGMMGSGVMGAMMGDRTLTQIESDFLISLGRTLWIAGLSGVVLALLLSSLFTKQIVAPLSKVTVAARRVAQGDLNQKVDIHGSSELAELGRSFSVMAASLSRDRVLRQNMVADIAHELRTPLSILQGNVEAMLDGVLVVNNENLTSLHQEILLLARLVEDLRTLSLAEAGQLRFHPQATELGELVSQVIDKFQPQFLSKNIIVALEVPEGLSPVWVDTDRTAQIMRNLLNNAYSYTPEGGKIIVRLTPDSQGVTVLVTDTGTGIPPEHLPYVFDRFYRVDRSRTRSTGGLGLGLSIVKQLVEAQGGHVGVTSEVGKGCTFFFHFPYAAKSGS